MLFRSKTELSNVNKAIQQKRTKYIPNNGLVQILNKKTPNLGDKYKNIQTTKEAKTFFIVLLVELVAENTFLKEKVATIKNKYLKDYKNLLVSKKLNPKEILFNNINIERVFRKIVTVINTNRYNRY